MIRKSLQQYRNIIFFSITLFSVLGNIALVQYVVSLQRQVTITDNTKKELIDSLESSLVVKENEIINLQNRLREIQEEVDERNSLQAGNFQIQDSQVNNNSSTTSQSSNSSSINNTSNTTFSLEGVCNFDPTINEAQYSSNTCSLESTDKVNIDIINCTQGTYITIREAVQGLCAQGADIVLGKQSQQGIFFANIIQNDISLQMDIYQFIVEKEDFERVDSAFALANTIDTNIPGKLFEDAYRQYIGDDIPGKYNVFIR